jgi:NhaA family Na+:H+ antiporter
MTKRLLTPFQKFIKIEGLSGILLLSTTIIALLWANSTASSSYTDLWNYELGFQTEGFVLVKPLILWINDGFMAVFFFLIGLEIKREIMVGELNTFKKMAFPLFGALGGMSVPALMYVVLNANPATSAGWGIPMATDIAFSLAILNALGSRVPLSLKIFLTAFAIVDDLGAVLVIAIFYSGAIKLSLLAGAIGLLIILYFLSFRGIYSKFSLFTVGAVVWLLFLKAGIHPTLAGVLLAFAVPLRQKIKTPRFIDNLIEITDRLRTVPRVQDPILTREQLHQIDHLEEWTERFRSPLQHLEHNLHGWVAYFIIPIFALANAGVLLRSDVPVEVDIITTITLCLVLGNSIGITSTILTVKKLRIISIPPQISNWHILGVAFLAGIGFTMAIFIASLAFIGEPVYITSAKIGILLGSLISAIIGYSILRFCPQKEVVKHD